MPDIAVVRKALDRVRGDFESVRDGLDAFIGLWAENLATYDAAMKELEQARAALVTEAEQAREAAHVRSVALDGREALLKKAEDDNRLVKARELAAKRLGEMEIAQQNEAQARKTIQRLDGELKIANESIARLEKTLAEALAKKVAEREKATASAAA